ncbi:unnamed protein product [Victoria cruziana]
MLAVIVLVLALTGRARSAADQVLDVDGNPVKAGIGYYMLPAHGSRSGGLTCLSSHGTCPPSVVQAESGFDRGTPLTFAQVTGKEEVRLATDLNIEFVSGSRCGGSAVWKYAGVDEVTGQRFITLGGAAGNPGPATVSNWFKIEKEGDHYALVFCPTVCEFCKVVCANVGVYGENGRQFLALSDPAFPVEFRRA